MFRHIALIVVLTAVALAAGIAMVPGEREQWTMLVRDGRNQEAIRALETRYSAGKREVDAVLHLYKLYMSFAEIDQATRIMRDFVADHPDEVSAAFLPLVEFFQSIVEDAAAVGLLRPGRPRRIVSIILQTATMTAVRSAGGRQPITGEEVWDFVEHAIVPDELLATRAKATALPKRRKSR